MISNITKVKMTRKKETELPKNNLKADLFGQNLTAPKTFGIKYAGSKLKILPHIANILQDYIYSGEIKTVLDGFSGSTRCSQAFASWGLTVHSNDIASYSRVLAECFLQNTKPRSFYEPIVEHLNNLTPIDGWFSQHYGGTEDEIKKPFQLKTTQKVDTIRQEIDKIIDKQKLGNIEKSVLLTSLMLALDEVDSTLGHFSAYLKTWSKRSFKDLWLTTPILQNSYDKKATKHQVSQEDIFKLVQNQSWDLAYFDPPYGSGNVKMPPSRVRYQAYYHFWNSLILNDQPELFGVNQRRLDSKDAVSNNIFEEFRRDQNGDFLAIKAVKELILQTQAKYILLSYNSGNPLANEQLWSFLNSNPAYKLVKTLEIDYRKNVMSKMTSTQKWLPSETKYVEFLFLLQKR